MNTQGKRRYVVALSLGCFLILSLVCLSFTADAGALRVAAAYGNQSEWESIGEELRSNSGIEVVVESFPAGELLISIVANFFAGRPFDVVMVRQDWLSELVDRGVLADLSDYADRFSEREICPVRWGDTLIGVSCRFAANWIIGVSSSTEHIQDNLVELLLLAGGPCSDSLLGFIPDQLDGFPDPDSASFDSSEPLNGVEIPGGYAGRVWRDESVFFFALVTDWLSVSEAEQAAESLAEIRPDTATDTTVGYEGFGFIGEEPTAEGSPGFGILVYRKGNYVVIVGSGILIDSAAPPSLESVWELGTRIEIGLSPGLMESREISPGDVGTCPDEGVLAPRAPSDPLTASLPVELKLKGSGNGEVVFTFVIQSIAHPESCPKDVNLMQVTTLITGITLGDTDGDVWSRGDVRVAGKITITFEGGKLVNGKLVDVIKQYEFMTEELDSVGKNETVSVSRILQQVSACARKIQVSLVCTAVDNDATNATSFLGSVTEMIIARASGDPCLGSAVKNAICNNKDRGKSSGGVGSMDALRNSDGDPLGDGFLLLTEIWKAD